MRYRRKSVVVRGLRHKCSNVEIDDIEIIERKDGLVENVKYVCPECYEEIETVMLGVSGALN